MKNLKLSTLLTAGVFALFSANASALILSFESSVATTAPTTTVETEVMGPQTVREAAHAKKDALDHKAAVELLVDLAHNKAKDKKHMKKEK